MFKWIKKIFIKKRLKQKRNIIVCVCAESTSPTDRDFDTYYHEECHKARLRYEKDREEKDGNVIS